MKVNYAIVYVSDMRQSVAFYRDVVGLPLRFETPGWTEFETEGATLALHASKVFDDERDEDDLPPGRWGSGFVVPDLDAFHRKMIDSQVQCINEPRDLFGARIAQYRDPDGLMFSVAQERG